MVNGATVLKEVIIIIIKNSLASETSFLMLFRLCKVGKVIFGKLILCQQIVMYNKLDAVRVVFASYRYYIASGDFKVQFLIRPIQIH